MAASTAHRPAIRRVAFTCDLLRFSLGAQGYRNGQASNLRWLRAVLGGLDEWPRMGIEVRTCGPATSFAELRRRLRSPAVLREYEADSELAWARHYDSDPGEVLPGWLDELLQAELVVGFELPPAVKRALHQRGRPYVSFHIHALRFLRDLCLGAATNDASLARQLERHAVAEAVLEAQVRRFKAQLHKHALAAFELPPGWPLLIGQTGRDSILIDKGRFADWDHFEARLEKLLKKHPGCVLLEHPMRADSSAIAQTLRARFGKPVVMSNANGYGVLFNEQQIPLAVTLASSLGVEAQAAGIPTRFLLGDPRERLLLAGVDVGSTRPLGHGVLGAAFWQELFEAPDSRPRRKAAADTGPFALGDNHLRNGLETWSYAQLEQGLVRTRARKVLLPAESTSADAEQALCGRLAGADAPVQGWSAPVGRPESDRGVDLFVGGRPVGLGEQRQFEASDPWAPLLLEGFHARESWGAWSARPEVRIRVALAPSAVAARARLRMRLSLRIFEGLLPRCPVCRVLQQGKTLALVFFRPTAPVHAEVDFDALALGPWCELDLQVSDTDSPSHTLGHHDERPLGIAFRQLAVWAMPDAGDAAVPGAQPAIWGVDATAPGVAGAAEAKR